MATLCTDHVVPGAAETAYDGDQPTAIVAGPQAPGTVVKTSRAPMNVAAFIGAPEPDPLLWQILLSLVASVLSEFRTQTNLHPVAGADPV